MDRTMNQTRITGMEDQILSLYAKDMSTRDIVAAFDEMYGAEISAGLVSQVTNAIGSLNSVIITSSNSIRLSLIQCIFASYLIYLIQYIINN